MRQQAQRRQGPVNAEDSTISDADRSPLVRFRAEHGIANDVHLWRFVAALDVAIDAWLRLLGHDASIAPLDLLRGQLIGGLERSSVPAWIERVPDDDIPFWSAQLANSARGARAARSSHNAYHLCHSNALWAALRALVRVPRGGGGTILRHAQ